MCQRCQEKIDRHGSSKLANTAAGCMFVVVLLVLLFRAWYDILYQEHPRNEHERLANLSFMQSLKCNFKDCHSS